jgi:hypothetical protein
MNHEPIDPPIWGSVLTKELVAGWSDDEIQALCVALDDAVMSVIQDHEHQRGK